MVHLALWMNTINVEWKENQMSEYSVCPLLCIGFMQLVSSGLIISWIRSSNSESTATAQWTYCSPGPGRATQRQCVWRLDGVFPQSAQTSLFLSPTTATFGTQSNRAASWLLQAECYYSMRCISKLCRECCHSIWRCHNTGGGGEAEGLQLTVSLSINQ